MIEFYYWQSQCPHNIANIAVLKAIEADFDLEVKYLEMQDNLEDVKRLNFFSPTFTIFDGNLRWTGPITYDLVKDYLEGKKISRRPYIVRSENQVINGQLKPFTPERHQDIRGLCCHKNCQGASADKQAWMKQVMGKYDLDHLGYLHYRDGNCVGGAEYLPSLAVPYHIPKDEQTAFISCVYASDPVFDYKKYPLETLEEDLKSKGFTRLVLIASDKVAFPNGPLDWFLDQGYKQKNMVYYEENDGAYQYLMEKRI